MKRLNDLFSKLNNLVRRYTDNFYRKDLLIDKDYISNNGVGRYYFIVRNTGTVCFSEDDFMNNPNAKITSDFYYNENSNRTKPNNFYIINVVKFDDSIPYGTIRKVEKF